MYNNVMFCKVLLIFNKYRNHLLAFCLLLYCFILCIYNAIGVEHIAISAIYLFFNYLHKKTKQLVEILIPIIVYGAIYDSLRWYPNYTFSAVYIKSLYLLEKQWFGIKTDNGIVTANEWFLHHTNWVLDVLAGFFYANWVTGIIGLTIYCWLKGWVGYAKQITATFFIVSIFALVLYYLFPAAPPWYVAQVGYDFTVTKGNAAGFLRFDNFFNIHFFDTLYHKNPNVFGAIPSIHSAYPLLFSLYAWKLVGYFGKLFCIFFPLVIWFGAVYFSHHYIIDVLAGISVTLLSFLIFKLYVVFKNHRNADRQDKYI